MYIFNTLTPNAALKHDEKKRISIWTSSYILELISWPKSKNKNTKKLEKSIVAAEIATPRKATGKNVDLITVALKY